MKHDAYERVERYLKNPNAREFEDRKLKRLILEIFGVSAPDFRAFNGSVMPKNLKRYYGRGELHFVTFSCYRRIALLRTIRARNLFVKALGAIRD